ncbi:MAG: UDP-N-acetylmuramoylalanine-D-glutamate ligase [Candidatus Curtissbacteria bacterium GW2011_GWC2_38_9]|uniref:UDP-N-acetylmuramoylalanine--D-glutamate ligase n=3 Tax=Candidatus Curtissiibacteriota TaxID=1752717 RepID=A0A1F5HR34_9BACT|nr:MAG: UDP-N-acetylmuramoylalanine-D-glutamate ligase [Candidatus Curtissbacteria bacterium GW2011_GWC2_38_9]KKS04038.1 MAG: UDP-N-acetylmuramoylalanine-D-glutamate ligase [Candidatus Curtissbacteria bacterium GW2011_GWA2_41_24]OGE06439.1 MAG: UDP-N-acetylmuramoylalanine--D-glutamate ligase [Candidatus Curtissbacteria bacterium RIFCSPLOWO2_02_41_11]
MKTIKDKKIAIIGFGKEGVSAANFLGSENQIIIIDQKSKEAIDNVFFKSLNIKRFEFFQIQNVPSGLKVDYIVRSPGVRPDDNTILNLKKNGAQLTSPTKIFFDLCQSEIIGVTGTKGKGTTVTLIYEMLKSQINNVFLAGNIGTPALEILPKVDRQSIVILELSSFQLIDLKKSPHIAVILMITSEHLDWHQDTPEYRRAKESIVSFQNENDFAIINQDFEVSGNFAQRTKAKVYFISTKQKTNGVYLESDSILSEIGKSEEICKTSQILLPGAHNLQNVLAAVACAKIYNIKTKNITLVLKTFKGLVHRLQLVREFKNIKFYNDSFSTIPETTVAAIEAFRQPKILILGGSSKNSDFSLLAQEINQNKSIKAIILVGQEATRIKKAIAKSGGTDAKIIEGANNMHQIISRAYQEAKSGDVVILSPACASFDMFKNYQDRGMQFIKEVKNLK